jgi:4-oxalocrotonate tautomerase
LNSLLPAGDSAARSTPRPFGRPGITRRIVSVAEVYIYFFEGRTIEQKRALVKEVTEVVARNLNGTPESITIQLIETPRHTKAKGGVLFSDKDAAQAKK